MEWCLSWPRGTLVFLTGGLGSFVSERLKLQKDDVQVLVYSAIAGAFGGFFGSPVIGAVGAFEYMFIKELNIYRHLIPGLIAVCCRLWCLLRPFAYIIFGHIRASRTLLLFVWLIWSWHCWLESSLA